MMNIIKLSALTLALTSASAMAGDCVNPAAPKIPDGASSTLSQMIAGQKAVKAFQTANIDYMSCVESRMAAEETAAAEGSKESAAAHDASLAEFNAAVTAEETVAGKFNVQIRAYKAANPQ